ncbi:hypothetical protein M0805_004694 [Coniferiporia weirii]|nr:hypothetical protein M0805_004694 [Coniferiporia weirii]
MSTQGEDSAAAAPYDANFVFPIRVIENVRVQLAPFIPAVHAEEFFAGSKDHPGLYTYLPYGPFDSVDSLLDEFVIGRVQKDPTGVLFAIIDKTGADGKHRIAGVVGLLNTSVLNQSTEIGYIAVLPDFQRTHVASNAVGLLLHYCIALPADAAGSTDTDSADSSPFSSGGGLGLRRVQWQAHADNAQSVRTAERMAFRKEGIARWQRMLPEDKRGHVAPPMRGGAGTGRHSWVLAVCWDDWELEGAKEVVKRQMER